MANTVFDGGTMAPGDLGVGKLTLSNSTWASGTRYAWQGRTYYDNDFGVSGDFLSISDLSLSAGVGALHVDVDVSLLSGFVNAPGVTNSWLIAQTFSSGAWETNLFAAISSWSGATNDFGWWVSTSAGGLGNNGQQLWLNYGAGEFTYAPQNFLVIPEPNVLLLWLSSLATIYAARRRLGKRKP